MKRNKRSGTPGTSSACSQQDLGPEIRPSIPLNSVPRSIARESALQLKYRSISGWAKITIRRHSPGSADRWERGLLSGEVYLRSKACRPDTECTVEAEVPFWQNAKIRQKKHQPRLRWLHRWKPRRLLPSRRPRRAKFPNSPPRTSPACPGA